MRVDWIKGWKKNNYKIQVFILFEIEIKYIVYHVRKLNKLVENKNEICITLQDLIKFMYNLLKLNVLLNEYHFAIIFFCC